MSLLVEWLLGWRPESLMKDVGEKGFKKRKRTAEMWFGLVEEDVWGARRLVWFEVRCCTSVYIVFMFLWIFCNIVVCLISWEGWRFGGRLRGSGCRR